VAERALVDAVAEELDELRRAEGAAEVDGEREVAARLPGGAHRARQRRIRPGLRRYVQVLVRLHVERARVEAEARIEGERGEDELLGDVRGGAPRRRAGNERLLGERLVSLPQSAHTDGTEDPPDGPVVEAHVGRAGGEAEKERRFVVAFLLVLLAFVVVAELAAAVLLKRRD